MSTKLSLKKDSKNTSAKVFISDIFETLTKPAVKPAAIKAVHLVFLSLYAGILAALHYEGYNFKLIILAALNSLLYILIVWFVKEMLEALQEQERLEKLKTEKSQ